VAPTTSLSDYFSARGTGSLKGVPANAVTPLTFNLAGPANNAPGFYNWDTKDFGPRLAVAYSPNASGGLFGSLFGGPGKPPFERVRELFMTGWGPRCWLPLTGVVLLASQRS
jgi:hypothetical protein